MKMRIEKIVVEAYQSGPREGEFRAFELPEGAVVLDSHLVWGRDSARALTITIAVAA